MVGVVTPAFAIVVIISLSLVGWQLQVVSAVQLRFLLDLGGKHGIERVTINDADLVKAVRGVLPAADQNDLNVSDRPDLDSSHSIKVKLDGDGQTPSGETNIEIPVYRAKSNGPQRDFTQEKYEITREKKWLYEQLQSALKKKLEEQAQDAYKSVPLNGQVVPPASVDCSKMELTIPAKIEMLGSGFSLVKKCDKCNSEVIP